MRDGTPDAGFLWRIGVGTLVYLVRRSPQISLGALIEATAGLTLRSLVPRRTEPSPAFPCRTPCAARFTPRARDASPPPCSRRRRGARPYRQLLLPGSRRPWSLRGPRPCEHPSSRRPRTTPARSATRRPTRSASTRATSTTRPRGSGWTSAPGRTEDPTVPAGPTKTMPEDAADDYPRGAPEHRDENDPPSPRRREERDEPRAGALCARGQRRRRPRVAARAGSAPAGCIQAIEVHEGRHAAAGRAATSATVLRIAGRHLCGPRPGRDGWRVQSRRNGGPPELSTPEAVAKTTRFTLHKDPRGHTGSHTGTPTPCRRDDSPG